MAFNPEEMKFVQTQTLAAKKNLWRSYRLISKQLLITHKPILLFRKTAPEARCRFCYSLHEKT